MGRFWGKPSPQEPEPVDDFLDTAVQVARAKAEKRGQNEREAAVKRDDDIVSQVMKLTTSGDIVPEIGGEEETGRTFGEDHESMNERVYITAETLIQVPENLKASFTAMRARLGGYEPIKIEGKYCVSLKEFQELSKKSQIQNLGEIHFTLYDPKSQKEIFEGGWNDFCFVQGGIYKRLHEVLKFGFTGDVYLK